MVQINSRIKQRHDTLANWTTNNIVLLDGELAVVDCGEQTRFKVGNGLSTFNQLPFVDQEVLSTKWVTANAVSQGLHAQSVPYGLAAGAYLCATANFSQALGYDAKSLSTDSYSFTWSGDDTRAIGNYYTSHGKGSFSINPLSGLSGVYIGEKHLDQILDERSGSKISVDGQLTDVNMVHMSLSDYLEKEAAGQLLSTELYLVSTDTFDAFGQQLKHLAPGTDLSDAVNLEQMLSALDSKQDILVGTTQEWRQQLSFQPKKGQIVIWSDKDTIVSSDQGGNPISIDIPGFKVGDGNAYNVDLPFAGDDIYLLLSAAIAQHVSSDTHLSSGDRDRWDHKITIGDISNPNDDGVVGETLVITRN